MDQPRKVTISVRVVESILIISLFFSPYFIYNDIFSDSSAGKQIYIFPVLLYSAIAFLNFCIVEKIISIAFVSSNLKIERTELFAAVIFIFLILLIINQFIFELLLITFNVIDNKDNKDMSEQIRHLFNYKSKLYFGAFAAVAFGVTAFTSWTRFKAYQVSQKQFVESQDQFRYTQEQNRNEEIETRFQEGIKLLGNDKESVRLGGISVLWEIVKEAAKEKSKNKEGKAYSLHEQVLDTICMYIRVTTNEDDYKKKHASKLSDKPSTEIQTIIDLLVQRKNKDEPTIVEQLKYAINFNSAILVGANFGEAHCKGALFCETHCQGAYFKGAHFEGAIFGRTHCEGAIFWETHCQGAYFKGAHFEGNTCFVQVNCEGAYFDSTIFKDSCCFGSSFKGSTFDYSKTEEIRTTIPKMPNTSEFLDGYFGSANFTNLKFVKDLHEDIFFTNFFQYAIYDEATIFDRDIKDKYQAEYKAGIEKYCEGLIKKMEEEAKKEAQESSSTEEGQ